MSGFSGLSGISGSPGNVGLSGTSGQSGTSGLQGDSGLSGWTGRSGTSGSSGASGQSATNFVHIGGGSFIATDGVHQVFALGVTAAAFNVAGTNGVDFNLRARGGGSGGDYDGGNLNLIPGSPYGSGTEGYVQLYTASEAVALSVQQDPDDSSKPRIVLGDQTLPAYAVAAGYGNERVNAFMDTTGISGSPVNVRSEVYHNHAGSAYGFEGTVNVVTNLSGSQRPHGGVFRTEVQDPNLTISSEMRGVYGYINTENTASGCTFSGDAVATYGTIYHRAPTSTMAKAIAIRGWIIASETIASGASFHAKVPSGTITNYADVLLGTDTVPTGQYGIYDASTRDWALANDSKKLTFGTSEDLHVGRDGLGVLGLGDGTNEELRIGEGAAAWEVASSAGPDITIRARDGGTTDNNGGGWIIQAGAADGSGTDGSVQCRGASVKIDGTAGPTDTNTGVLSLGGGNSSYCNLKAIQELTTLSGATTATSANLLPADTFIVGVTFYVETTITGATTWDAGPTSGTANQYADDIALTSGTVTSSFKHATPVAPFINGTDNTITFTANGSDFTGGKIRTVVFYYDLTEAGS